MFKDFKLISQSPKQRLDSYSIEMKVKGGRVYELKHGNIGQNSDFEIPISGFYFDRQQSIFLSFFAPIVFSRDFIFIGIF